VTVTLYMRAPRFLLLCWPPGNSTGNGSIVTFQSKSSRFRTSQIRLSAFIPNHILCRGKCASSMNSFPACYSPARVSRTLQRNSLSAWNWVICTKPEGCIHFPSSASRCRLTGFSPPYYLKRNLSHPKTDLPLLFCFSSQQRPPQSPTIKEEGTPHQMFLPSSPDGPALRFELGRRLS